MFDGSWWTNGSTPWSIWRSRKRPSCYYQSLYIGYPSLLLFQSLCVEFVCLAAGSLNEIKVIFPRFWKSAKLRKRQYKPSSRRRVDKLRTCLVVNKRAPVDAINRRSENKKTAQSYLIDVSKLNRTRKEEHFKICEFGFSEVQHSFHDIFPTRNQQFWILKEGQL